MLALVVLVIFSMLTIFQILVGLTSPRPGGGKATLKRLSGGIVAMASNYERLHHELPKTLQSLLKQTVLPDEIRIYFSIEDWPALVKPGSEFEQDLPDRNLHGGNYVLHVPSKEFLNRVPAELKDPRVRIYFAPNRGPASKYIYAIQERLVRANIAQVNMTSGEILPGRIRSRDEMIKMMHGHQGTYPGRKQAEQIARKSSLLLDAIVVCDDDHYYPPNWFETLMSFGRDMPGAAVGFRGWRVRRDLLWGVKSDERRAHVVKGHQVVNPYQVGVLTGSNGYLIRPWFFLPALHGIGNLHAVDQCTECSKEVFELPDPSRGTHSQMKPGSEFPSEGGTLPDSSMPHTSQRKSDSPHVRIAAERRAMPDESSTNRMTSLDRPDPNSETSNQPLVGDVGQLKKTAQSAAAKKDGFPRADAAAQTGAGASTWWAADSSPPTSTESTTNENQSRIVPINDVRIKSVPEAPASTAGQDLDDSLNSQKSNPKAPAQSAIQASKDHPDPHSSRQHSVRDLPPPSRNLRAQQTLQMMRIPDKKLTSSTSEPKLSLSSPCPLLVPVSQTPQAPVNAIFADDIWLSGHLAALHVPRFVVPASAAAFDVTRTAVLENVLEDMDVHRGEANRAVLAYFADAWKQDGVWYRFKDGEWWERLEKLVNKKQ
ncbi:hypothetical protein DFS34DRAFT_595618 [Phlyctochytrium arcticum]|nr:hypothetical protein DFS34DRAFT_595618 [Phlyctochytrium arcticum]